MSIRLLCIHSLVLLSCSALLCACSATIEATGMGSSPVPMHQEDIITPDEVNVAYEQKQSIECTIEKSGFSQPIHAFIQGEKVLLTNISIRGEAPIGMILLHDSMMYAWKDGSTKGWKATVPPKEDIPKLIDRLHNIGIWVPNVTSAQAIQHLTEQGFTIQCEKTSPKQGTFIPRESVQYTDVSGTLVNSLRIFEHTSPQVQQ